MAGDSLKIDIMDDSQAKLVKSISRHQINRTILALLIIVALITGMSILAPMMMMEAPESHMSGHTHNSLGFDRLEDFINLLNTTEDAAPRVDYTPLVQADANGQPLPPVATHSSDLTTQPKEYKPVPPLPIPNFQQPIPPPPPPKAPEAPVLQPPAIKAGINDPAVFTRGGPQADVPKADAVKGAMRWAWDAYDSKCWGQDELQPVSQTCGNWLNMGLTIIDALDTMMVMGGFEAELEKMVNWVDNTLDATPNKDVSFFETVIRMVGGLNAAYDISKDERYLRKSKAVGDALLPAFKTKTGLPMSTINMKSGRARLFGWTSNSALLAEVGTVQLEYFELAHYLNEPLYFQTAQQVIDHMDNMHPTVPGLYPIYLDTNKAKFNNDQVTFGAMGDSFYEYLLKMWLLTGKKDDQYLRMYRESMDGLANKLFHKVQGKDGMGYVADLERGNLKHKMDHLACFVGGMLGLGAHTGASSDPERDMMMAEHITAMCYESYRMQVSGIGPEYMNFNAAGIKNGQNLYHLRPETVESLFIMYRITHDQKYRDWGWEIFQAIERHCKVDTGGYTGLADVTRPEKKQNKMESFFLAETLKYLYLLFENDSVINIDEWVFNTECHPVRVFENNSGLTRKGV